MLPVHPLDNPSDVSLICTELLGDSLQGQSGSPAHLADGNDIGLGELRVAVLAALVSMAVANAISRIFFWCCPAKVASAIVEAVAIPMRCMMALRRAFAVEGHTDDYVQRHPVANAAPIPSEMHAIIAASQGRPHENARMEALPAIAVDDHAIQRAHAPKARCLIARMVGHWTPFFNFSYRIASHIALLQRCGQGLATGGNLSSVPYSNGRSLKEQAIGISILAARV